MTSPTGRTTSCASPRGASTATPRAPTCRCSGRRVELGDLRALVKREGLEGALRRLREQGVYVRFEEFKGREPIVRGRPLRGRGQGFDNPSGAN